MTLVDLNPMELDFLLTVLRFQKQKILVKQPLPEFFENAPNEIQSIIYKLEKALKK